MVQKTIFIVDDNPEFCQSTSWWMSSAGFHVESFDNPVTALEVLSTYSEMESACLLLDVRMPEMSGLDMHDVLNERGINLPVIYMTGHGDVPLAVEAMKKGAVTFLEKPFEDAKLESALEAAFNRSRQVLSQSLKHDPEASQETPEHKQTRLIFEERYAKLTPRERQVLEGIVEGKPNKVIARDLGISVKTVELHRARVLSKLETKSLTELIKMVIIGRGLNAD